MLNRFPAIGILLLAAFFFSSLSNQGAWANSSLPGRWSSQVPVTANAPQFFVAPDGKPTGTGAINSPWDLETAISGKQKAIVPGSVVWLRGGTYGQGKATLFNCGLVGSEAKPIFLRQYPGERATIDGGITAQAPSQWVWFWGFEITNSSTERRCLTSERPHGLNLSARGHKAVNLVVHDAGHPGIGFWVGVGDTGEIHGCLLYNNGLYDMGDKRFPNGWTRGSPIYAQNKDGIRFITDTIAFRNFTTGMKAYTEGGFADGFHFEGNITFDSPDWNLFGSGGKKNAMQRLKVLNNCTYRRADDPVRESVQFGYHNNANVDALVKDNYFVLSHGGDRGMFLSNWQDVTFTGNTIISQELLATWKPSPVGAKAVWDNNTYISDSAAPFLFQKDKLGFDQWRKDTGFDKASTLSKRLPNQQKIFVRANKYEPGRGNIAVYNWSKAPTAAVDLSLVLRPGDKYEVRDAQNFFAKPVVAGTYDGKPVILPMNLKEIAPLVGNVTHIKYLSHTAPQFAVFVVLTMP